MKSVFVLKRNGHALTQHDIENDLMMWYQRTSFIAVLMSVAGCMSHGLEGSVKIILERGGTQGPTVSNYNVIDDGCEQCARSVIETLEKRFGPRNMDLQP